eukprot:1733580-Rhodomonas_salina.1
MICHISTGHPTSCRQANTAIAASSSCSASITEFSAWLSQTHTVSAGHRQIQPEADRGRITSSIISFFNLAGCLAARSASASAISAPWIAARSRSSARCCFRFCSRIRLFMRSGGGGSASRLRAFISVDFWLQPTLFRQRTPALSR